MMIIKTFLLALVLTMLTLSASFAATESIDGDRFSVSLGIFLTDRDTDTRLDGAIVDGTQIDLESDLGLDASYNVFRIDGYYRFNDRHRFDFSVFDMSRGSSKHIDRDMQWGERLFVIDTRVETDFDLIIYKAAYTYSFMQREKGSLGATIGLHIVDTKVSLAEQNLGRAEVAHITAPLPVIGLRGNYEFADRWTFRASGEIFFIEFDHIRGSLVDLYAVLDFAVRESVSVGFGYNSVVINMDVSKGGFRGSLDWRYSGGLLFLKFDF